MYLILSVRLVIYTYIYMVIDVYADGDVYYKQYIYMINLIFDTSYYIYDVYMHDIDL